MRAAQFLAIIGRGSKGSNALENTEDRAGATSEQQDNVINTVNSLDPYGPSWQLVPGNVAAGTVYAQVPTSGTGDLAFTRASTKTRTNAAGTVVDVASGVAAIDYRNADGSLSSSGRLILEPQRTNIALQSETFSNATWAKSNATISADFTTAPSGTLTADKLIANTANDQHRIDQTSTSVIGTNVFSVYAKKAELSFIQLRIGLAGAYFDLNNGTIVGTSAGLTASIQDAGNNWYRCTIIRTSVIINEVIRINLATALNINNFIGNGTEGIFIWGAQLEVGAYASSYIPTTTAEVTRVADSIIRNDLFTNSIVTSAGGTWFVDLSNNVSVIRDTSGGLFLGDGTSPNLGNQWMLRIASTPPSSQRIALLKYFASSPTNFSQLPQDAKLAISWNGSTANIFVNGVKTVTDTPFTATNLQNLRANGVGAPFFLNEMALFPTPLTDAQCIEMTTL